MPVLKNISFLASCKYSGTQGDIHVIHDAAIAWDGATISWVGTERELPAQYQAMPCIDARGRMVVPGLIDSHTHLGFAGWRADEFELRVQGKSYLDIAKAGGGILSTVSKTRLASAAELVKRCKMFLSEMSTLGITTVECKSGYGLTFDDELKILAVYKTLRDAQPLGIVSTFMGAHTIPGEFKDNRRAYIDLITRKLIPRVAHDKLAEFCDVFVEQSAFSAAEAQEIIEAARSYNLSAKLHVDQLSDGGGAALAAKVGAVSASHLEHACDDGLACMAAAKVSAELLPFASIYTAQPPFDARRAIARGLKVVVATDFNPGSAPSYHLPWAMTLACTTSRMTPAEVLKAATIYAASALKVDDIIGSLEQGKDADMAIIDAKDINHWLYHPRANACVMSIKRGKVIYEEAQRNPYFNALD